MQDYLVPQMIQDENVEDDCRVVGYEAVKFCKKVSPPA